MTLSLYPTMYVLHPDGSHSAATEREVRGALEALEQERRGRPPDDWEIWLEKPAYSIGANHRGRWVGEELHCWDCPAAWSPSQTGTEHE